MARIFNKYLRIEPKRSVGDLAEGIRMEAHDPEWILGRQWRMGEHQGENASSHVSIKLKVSEIEVESIEGMDGINLQSMPPEALIEGEAEDWWTPGRRVLYGRRASAEMPPLNNADPKYLLDELPYPYDGFKGVGYDGYELYKDRQPLNLSPGLFADVPQNTNPSFWSSSRFRYDADFNLKNGTNQLELKDHRGGALDWWSVDAKGPLPQPQGNQIRSIDKTIVGRLTFPGAPHPRLWMLENHSIDIAGSAPSRSHFATLLLIECLAGLGDNWFQFPVTSKPGVVLQIEEAEVIDSFNETWKLTPPTDWKLFGVKGLDGDSVLLWPKSSIPLEGKPLEEVALGIDEDANLLFAVERRVGGRDLVTAPSETPVVDGVPNQPDSVINANADHGYKYRANSEIKEFWHPYVIDKTGSQRRFIQARFQDLSKLGDNKMPLPKAQFLPTDPPHWIDPSSVPESGLALIRRVKLTRALDGSPLLWVERRQLPLIAPPQYDLNFDDAEHRTVAE